MTVPASGRGASEGFPPWLAPFLTEVPAISGDRALLAINEIRAISWRWRLRSVLLRPRLLRGVGRRHYGVAAQDVEAALADAVPGIVRCTHGARCQRHLTGDGACTGTLRVDYVQLAVVAIRAAERLGESGRRIAALPTVPRQPSPAIQRYCYDLVAEIHAAAPSQPEGLR